MPSKFSSLITELVKESTNEHGIIDKSLVKNVLVGLKEINSPMHQEILKEFLTEITKTLRFQLVEVEFGSETSKSVMTKLKDKISATINRPLDFKFTTNKGLIAGYRIKLVDDVFEDSVQSRLSKLSQSFTS